MALPNFRNNTFAHSQDSPLTFEELRLLAELQDRFFPPATFEARLPEVLLFLAEAYALDGIALYLLSPRQDELTLHSRAGLENLPPALMQLPADADHPLVHALFAGQSRQWMGPIWPGETAEPAGTFLACPLTIERQSIGVLLFYRRSSGTFSPRAGAFLQEYIASRLAFAIYQSRLIGWTQKQLQQMTVLNEVAQTISSNLDIHQLLETLYRQVQRVIDAASYFVVLVDEETGQLRLEILFDEGERFPPQIFPSPTGLVGWILQHRRPLRLDNLAQESKQMGITPKPVGQPRSSNSWLGVPMMVGERVIGILAVASYSYNAFSSDDELLLSSIASQAAVAVENARLYEKARRQLEELRRTQEQLLAAARLATSAELAAGLGHEVNNALTPILGIAQLALRRTDLPADLRTDLETLCNSAQRIREIVNGFSQMTTEEGLPASTPHGINQLVQAALESFEWRLQRQGITAHLHLADDLPPIAGNPWQLRQSLLNIIQNALEAMPAGGTLTITTSPHSNGVQITIQDTGPGFDPDHLHHVFEPGYTTKVEGGRMRGLGLGLFVSYNILQAHGGTIQVTNVPEGGARVDIWLPAGR
ncbi:MAG: GAF domain-containing protein [Anaerolineae bacterium]